MYTVLADLILVAHFAYVAFVVVGLFVVWLGFFLRWGWVRNFYFRGAHLAAIGVVVAEALLGWVCPLTTWEHQLRVAAGEGGAYEESFLQHWIHQVMFFDLGAETFTAIYCLFFLAVALSLVSVRPHAPSWLLRRREVKVS